MFSKLIPMLCAAAVPMLFAPWSWSQEKISLAIGAGQKGSIVGNIQEKFETETSIKIELLSKEGMGGTNVIIAVDTGRAEVGVAAFDRELTIESIEKSGNSLKNKNALQYAAVGIDTSHFILHPGIGKKSLSAEEIEKILSGDASNWKELGGPDAKIQFAYPAKFTATKPLLIKSFNNGRPLRTGVKFLSSFEEIIDFVATTPGAFGFGGNALMSSRVGQPTHPPLDRIIWFVTLGDPSPRAQKLLDMLKAQSAPKK